MVDLPYTAAIRGIRPEAAPDEEGQSVVRTRADVNSPWVWVKQRNWLRPSIDYTGGVDATATIRNLALQRPGACVALSDGVVRLNSTLALPNGCTLTYEGNRGMRAGDRVFSGAVPVGCRLDIYHTGVAFDMTGQECSVQNVGIYYPGQQTNATPTFYDYTFNVTGIGSHISNVTCVNPYQFIKCAANGARFDNLYAYPLVTGIYLGRCPDVIRTSNVHFSPLTNYQFGSTLTAWVQANCAAYVVDGAEAFMFTDCFAFGVDSGLRFADMDGDGFRGSSGSFKGGSFDQCGACIRVDPTHGLSLTGVSVYGMSFDTKIGGGNTVLFLDTQVPGSIIERPGVWLTDCHANAPGATMQRFVWTTSGSYGQCNVGGNAAVVNVANEVYRNDSANANITQSGWLRYPAGTALIGGTGPINISGGALAL